MGRSIIGSGALLRKMKGVKHPDDTIDPKTRHLYLPSNRRFTPLGRFPSDPMELYFGRGRRRRSRSRRLFGRGGD